MEKIIALAGPTASGKTELSLRLAQVFNGEIISADAFQIYKGLNIGTAKINKTMMCGIHHYMIDEYEATASVSVHDYSSKVLEYVKTIQDNNKTVLLVGGSGLYLDSIVYDSYHYPNTTDDDYRHNLYELLNKHDEQYLYEMLNQIDPEYALITHPNNAKRVIRALEYHHATGLKKSSLQKNSRYRYPNTTYLAIKTDTQVLYDRINSRVDKMVKEGLIEEVRQLLDSGCSEASQSMQAIGYKELIPVIKGTALMDDAINKIKQNSRNYAKRQMTWFRKNKDIIWIDSDTHRTMEEMLNFAEGKIHATQQ